MPIRKEDYPANWKEISLQVRTDANWKCEWCSAPNGRVIRRFEGGAWALVEEAQAHITAAKEKTETMTYQRLKSYNLTRVWLTVAHLDRNTRHNERENLAALCQRCHLSYDMKQHVSNRLNNRDLANEHQLKLLL